MSELKYVKFNFLSVCPQSPSFNRIRPAIGPVSGGTRLTVFGRHLDAGSSVVVSINKEECLFVKSVPSLHCLCNKSLTQTLNTHEPPPPGGPIEKSSVLPPPLCLALAPPPSV